MPTVDGIVSGLDTTSLISALLSPQRVTIETLNGRVARAESQRSAIATLKTKFADLSSAIRAMNTPELFNVNSVTVTGSQFTATVDSSALTGSYDIQVLQLAAGQISQSGTFEDPDAADLATGTLSVTVGGTTTALTIDGTNNNYADLAEALDAVDGLSAFVLDTGAAVGRYQLVVQGETGADNAFSFDTTGLGGGTVPAFADTKTAVDARIVVAGVTVYLDSNVASGVLPGLTLSLVGVGLTADTAVVSQDQAAMQAKLQAVVDAYNAILDEYDLQTVFNPDAGIKGPLVGDSSARTAVSDIGSLITGSFTVAGTDLVSLAQLGIETQQDGRLEFDATAFQEAFDADPDGVTLFLTDSSGPLTTVADRIDDLYVDETDGILTTRDATLEGIIEDLNEQVATAEERLVTMSDILRARFNAMEQTLSRIQATGSYINLLFPQSQQQAG